MAVSSSNGNDDNNNDEPRKTELCRQVSVVDCTPCRADDPQTGEPVCRLTLSHLGKAEPSVILGLNDTRILVAKLIAALECFGDPLAARIDNFYLQDGLWPSVELCHRRRARAGKVATVRPSVMPKMPPTPLSEVEAWRMIQMVRHVPDHSAFLRFMGAEPLPRPRTSHSKPQVKKITTKRGRNGFRGPGRNKRRR